MSVNPFVGGFWQALGGRPELVERLALTGDGDLPSVYRVTDLAAASIGVAGLAAAELVHATAQAPATDAAPAVSTDRLLASAWFGSAVRPVGWSTPPVWSPYTRNYRADGGWIRIHVNARQHLDAVLGVLGLASDPDPADVRRLVGRWSPQQLEDAIVAAGGCAAVLHSRDEWLRHPQGTAVVAEPLVEWREGFPGSPGEGWQPTVARPLAGLRVLDLTRVIAGPVASRFLAGLGAAVLRIDPPGWDEDALVPNMTLGKRSARLDAKTPGGREALFELVRQSDVLVHGYRPGALDALGLDVESRQSLRPGLVDVSLDAYGFTGPWAGRRGFDSLVQVSCGIAQRGMEWSGDERPHALPVQALDHATGYLLAAAALRGLVRLRAEGVGSSARTSLARVAEALVAGGELPRDGEFDQWEGDLLPLDTPWGPASMLPPPVEIDGTPFAFERGPRALGSDSATWR